MERPSSLQLPTIATSQRQPLISNQASPPVPHHSNRILEDLQIHKQKDQAPDPRNYFKIPEDEVENQQQQEQDYKVPNTHICKRFIDCFSRCECAKCKNMSKVKKIRVRCCIRLVTTFIVLFSILLVLILGAVSVKTETYTIQADDNLNISLKNCQLHFEESKSVSDGQAQIHIQSSLYYTKINRSSQQSAKTPQAADHTLEIINTSDTVYSCLLQIKLPSSSSSASAMLNSMYIVCQQGSECILIQHNMSKPLKFAEQLIIHSSKAQININFTNVEAKIMKIQSTKGFITLNQAKIQTEADLHTNNGDIIFQSTQSFSPQWKEQNQYYCLAYPSTLDAFKVNQVSNGCILSTQTPNQTITPKQAIKPNCTASFDLKQTSTSNSPTIKLSAPNGAIYANMIPQAGKFIPFSGYNITQGAGFELPLNFTSSYLDSFKTIAEQFNKENTKDHLIVMDIGNMKSRSSGSTKIVVSPNEAYLDMRPFSTTIMSMWLLIGEPFLPNQGRLLPGFCPYRNSFSAEQYNQMIQLIQDQLKVASFIDILYPQDYLKINLAKQQQIKTQTNLNQTSGIFIQNSGYMSSSAEEDWVKIKFNENRQVYQFHKDKLLSQPELLIAVTLSIIIAILLFIFFMAYLQKVSYYALDQLRSSSIHVRRYASNYMKNNNQDMELEKKLQKIPVVQGMFRAKRLNKLNQRDPLMQQRNENSISRQNISNQSQANEQNDSQENILHKQGQQKQHLAIQDSKRRKIVRFFNDVEIMPSNFMFVDHFIVQSLNNWNDSKTSFFQLLFGSSMNYQEYKYRAGGCIADLKLSEIDVLYQKYCFLNRKTELQLNNPQTQKILAYYGYQFHREIDASNEAFVKIKIKSKNSFLRQKKAQKSYMKESSSFSSQTFVEEFTSGDKLQSSRIFSRVRHQQNSLDRFINQRCSITGFESDQELIEQFKHQYYLFCNQEKIPVISHFSKNLMSKKYNIFTKKCEHVFIVKDSTYPKEFELKELLVRSQVRRKFYIPSTLPVKQQINRLLHAYDFNSEKQQNQTGDQFTHLFWLIDIILPLSHIALILLYTVGPVLLAIFSQIAVSWYSLAPPQNKLTILDFTVTPSSIPYKIFNTLSPFIVIILIMTITFFVISFFDIISYYSTMVFPVKTLHFFDPDTERKRIHKRKCCNLCCVSAITSYFFKAIMVGLFFGYICLFLTWAILGALLNPTTYLAYSSAAGTVIGFVVIKYRQLQNLRKKGFDQVIRILEQSLGDKMKTFMITYLGSDELNADAQVKAIQMAIRDPSRADQAVINFVIGSSSGQNGILNQFESMTGVKNIGKIVPLVLRLAKDSSDQAAISELASQVGVTQMVVMLFISILKGDQKNVMKSLKGIVREDPFRMPEEVVDFVVRMKFKGSNGKDEVQNLINILAKKVFIEIKLKQEQLWMKKMPYFDKLEIDFPLLFQSGRSLVMRDPNSAVIYLERYNNAIIKAEAKSNGSTLQHQLTSNRKFSIYSRRLSRGQSMQSLERAQNEQKNSIPPEWFSVLEFIKILFNSKGYGQAVNKDKVRYELQRILNSFVKLDPAIFNFLQMLSKSSSDIKKDRKMKQKIEQFAKVTGFDAQLIKLSFKFRLNLREDTLIIKKYPVDLIREIAQQDKQFKKKSNSFQLKYQRVNLLNTLYQLVNVTDPYLNLKRTLQQSEDIPKQQSVIIMQLISLIFWNNDSEKDLVQARQSFVQMIGKRIFLQPKQTFGLLNLLNSKYLLSEGVNRFFKSLFVRNQIDIKTNMQRLVNKIQALIALAGARTIKDCCFALQNFPELQKYTNFVLVFKRLSYPNNLNINSFEFLKSIKNCDLMKNRFNTNNKHDLSRWIQLFQRAVLQNNFQQSSKNNNAESGPNLNSPQLNQLNSILPKFLPSSQIIIKGKLDRTNQKINQQLKIIKILLQICFEQSIDSDTIDFLFSDWTESIDKIKEILSFSDVVTRFDRANVSIISHTLADLMGCQAQIISGIIFLINVWKVSENYQQDQDQQQQQQSISASLFARKGKPALNQLISNLSYKETMVKDAIQQIYPNENVNKIFDFFIHEIIPKQLYFYNLEKRISGLNDVLLFSEAFIKGMFLGNSSIYLNDQAESNAFQKICKWSGLEDYRFAKQQYLGILQSVFNSYISDQDVEVLKNRFQFSDTQSKLLRILINGSSQNSHIYIPQTIQLLKNQMISNKGINQKASMISIALLLALRLRDRLNLQFQIDSDYEHQKAYADPTYFLCHLVQFLSFELGVPEIFLKTWLNSSGKPDHVKIKNLEEMYTVITNCNTGPREVRQNMNMMPLQIFQGISSILCGKLNNTENLAELCQAPSVLIDTCVLLSNIAVSKYKGGDGSSSSSSNFKLIDSISQMQNQISFKQFSELVMIPSNMIIQFIKQSYNLSNNQSDISNFSNLIGLSGILNDQILFAISSLVKYGKQQNYKMSKENGSIVVKKDASLLSNIYPILNALKLNGNLAQLSIRLKQGDVAAIDTNFQQFLNPILPNRDLRNLAKGVIGIINSSSHSNIFKQSIKELQSLLKIPPILFQRVFQVKNAFACACSSRQIYNQQVREKVKFIILLNALCKITPSLALKILKSELWRTSRSFKPKPISRLSSSQANQIRAINQTQYPTGIQNQQINFSGINQLYPGQSVNFNVPDSPQLTPQKKTTNLENILDLTSSIDKRPVTSLRQKTMLAQTDQSPNRQLPKISQIIQSPTRRIDLDKEFSEVSDQYNNISAKSQGGYLSQESQFQEKKQESAQMHRTMYVISQQIKSDSQYQDFFTRNYDKSQTGLARQYQNRFKAIEQMKVEGSQYQDEEKVPEQQQQEQDTCINIIHAVEQRIKENKMINLKQHNQLENYLFDQEICDFISTDFNQVMKNDFLKQLYNLTGDANEKRELEDIFNISEKQWQKTVKSFNKSKLWQQEFQDYVQKSEKVTLSGIIFAISLKKVKNLSENNEYPIENFNKLMAEFQKIITYLSTLDSFKLFNWQFNSMRFLKLLALSIDLPLSNIATYWKQFEYIFFLQSLSKKISETTLSIPSSQQQSSNPYNQSVFKKLTKIVNPQQSVVGEELQILEVIQQYLEQHKMQDFFKTSSSIIETEIAEDYDVAIQNYRYIDILNSYAMKEWNQLDKAKKLNRDGLTTQGRYKDGGGKCISQLYIPCDIFLMKSKNLEVDLTSGQSISLIQNFFYQWEVFSIKNRQIVQFVNFLSLQNGKKVKQHNRNQQWTNMKSVFRDQKVLENDKELILYRDFFNLITFYQISEDVLKQTRPLKSIISNLLQHSNLIKVIDIQMLQDLILISHNIIQEHSLSKMSSIFRVKITLLNAFFLNTSSKIPSHQLLQIYFSEFKVQVEEVEALLQILRNKQEGWEKLYCCVVNSLSKSPQYNATVKYKQQLKNYPTLFNLHINKKFIDKKVLNKIVINKQFINQNDIKKEQQKELASSQISKYILKILQEKGHEQGENEFFEKYIQLSEGCLKWFDKIKKDSQYQIKYLSQIKKSLSSIELINPQNSKQTQEKLKKFKAILLLGTSLSQLERPSHHSKFSLSDWKSKTQRSQDLLVKETQQNLGCQKRVAENLIKMMFAYKLEVMRISDDIEKLNNKFWDEYTVLRNIFKILKFDWGVLLKKSIQEHDELKRQVNWLLQIILFQDLPEGKSLILDNFDRISQRPIQRRKTSLVESKFFGFNHNQNLTIPSVNQMPNKFKVLNPEHIKLQMQQRQQRQQQEKKYKRMHQLANQTVNSKISFDRVISQRDVAEEIKSPNLSPQKSKYKDNISIESLLINLMIGNLGNISNIFVNFKNQQEDLYRESNKNFKTIQFLQEMNQVIAMRDTMFEKQLKQSSSKQNLLQKLIKLLSAQLLSKSKYEDELIRDVTLQRNFSIQPNRLIADVNQQKVNQESEKDEQDQEGQFIVPEVMTPRNIEDSDLVNVQSVEKKQQIQELKQSNANFPRTVSIPESQQSEQALHLYNSPRNLRKAHLKQSISAPSLNYLKAQNDISSFKVISFVLTMLFALRFDFQRREIIIKKIRDFIKSIFQKSPVDNEIKNHFQKLISAFFGVLPQNVQFTKFKASRPVLSIVDRVFFLSESVMNIYFQPLIKENQQLEQVIFLFFEIVHELQTNLTQDTVINIAFKLVPQLSSLFEVDQKLLRSIIKMISLDIHGVAQLLEPILHINTQQFYQFLVFVSQILGRKDEYNIKFERARNKKELASSNKMKDLMAKIQIGQASEDDLFNLIDSEFNKSGQIEEFQFKMAMQRVGIILSDHRVSEIFSKAQALTQNDDNPNALNKKEFKLALTYIKETQGNNSLKVLGLSVDDIIWFFVIAFIILLLLFAFILFGVVALRSSNGGTFESIISSALPILAGVFVGKPKATDVTDSPENTQAAVKKAEKIMSQSK